MREAREKKGGVTLIDRLVGMSRGHGSLCGVSSECFGDRGHSRGWGALKLGLVKRKKGLLTSPGQGRINRTLKRQWEGRRKAVGTTGSNGTGMPHKGGSPLKGCPRGPHLSSPIFSQMMPYCPFSRSSFLLAFHHARLLAPANSSTQSEP